jgi:hypothetical protein
VRLKRSLGDSAILHQLTGLIGERVMVANSPW